MNIFFDTEFTGLHKDTTLISVGLVAENGDSFYGEFADYDTTQVDEWIQKNVIDNLTLEKEISFGWHEVSDTLTLVRGNRFAVREALNDWLDQFDTIEWVSDVCHYDFVLLIDLVYGHALKMPYGKHCSACHDINQEIAEKYNISEIKAFDKSREELVTDAHINGAKHNSLYDAVVIKVIYDMLNK
jgi:viroplasmin and RNaseH domain-containing protein